MLVAHFKKDMKYLIIPEDRVEKIKSIEFPKPHALNPIKGELNGKEVYFLQEDLKRNKIFAKALSDFEVCEVKEIETIDQKYFDKETEITDISKTDTSVLTYKTVLTATVIEPIKIEPIIIKR